MGIFNLFKPEPQEAAGLVHPIGEKDPESKTLPPLPVGNTELRGANAPLPPPQHDPFADLAALRAQVLNDVDQRFSEVRIEEAREAALAAIREEFDKREAALRELLSVMPRDFWAALEKGTLTWVFTAEAPERGGVSPDHLETIRFSFSNMEIRTREGVFPAIHLSVSQDYRILVLAIPLDPEEEKATAAPMPEKPAW